MVALGLVLRFSLAMYAAVRLSTALEAVGYIYSMEVPRSYGHRPRVRLRRSEEIQIL